MIYESSFKAVKSEIGLWPASFKQEIQYSDLKCKFKSNIPRSTPAAAVDTIHTKTLPSKFIICFLPQRKSPPIKACFAKEGKQLQINSSSMGK